MKIGKRVIIVELFLPNLDLLPLFLFALHYLQFIKWINSYQLAPIKIKNFDFHFSFTELRERIRAHFSSDHMTPNDIRLSQEMRRIEWLPTAGEFSALLLEAQLSA